MARSDGLSETATLEEIVQEAKSAKEQLRALSAELRRRSKSVPQMESMVNIAHSHLVAIDSLALILISQVRRGVHKNPPLVIFGNPGARKMSDDVLAILYRHAKDGEFYCHGFGDAHLELEGDPKRGVRIGGLKTRTGVQMIAQKDGSVVVRHPTKTIWKDFD